MKENLFVLQMIDRVLDFVLNFFSISVAYQCVMIWYRTNFLLERSIILLIAGLLSVICSFLYSTYNVYKPMRTQETCFQNYLFSMENPQICLSRVFFSLLPNQGLLQPPVHNILCVYVCLLRGRNDNALKASLNWIPGCRLSLTSHRTQTLTQIKKPDAFSSEVPSVQLWPCG